MPDDDPRLIPAVTDPTGRDELALTLCRHVTTLAAAPRNRKADTEHLKAVRDYAGDQLRAAGWSVTTQGFTTSAALGVSDAGYPTANLWPLRVRGAADGVNIIATRGGPITKDTFLVLAHLDSVRNSPAADDNASGAAAILAAATGIPLPPGRRDVALVLVDMADRANPGRVKRPDAKGG